NNDLCCGASGSQLLSKSSFAERLRQKKLDALNNLTGDGQQPVNTLVTSNISCALHLAAGIREQGIPAEVIHPITLLMKHIDSAQTCTSNLTSAKVAGKEVV
ncbi:heterodisulfide reductase-related iron-sulfur binding cluster, partial [Kaarinaea lacus]